jgi:hypothetical protein
MVSAGDTIGLQRLHFNTGGFQHGFHLFIIAAHNGCFFQIGKLLHFIRQICRYGEICEIVERRFDDRFAFCVDFLAAVVLRKVIDIEAGLYKTSRSYIKT